MGDKNVRHPVDIVPNEHKIEKRMSLMHDKRQFFIRLPREFEQMLKLDLTKKYIADIVLNYPIPVKDPLEEIEIKIKIKHGNKA